VPEINDLTEKNIFEWDSYERPHKVWTKEFYSSVIVIAFLVSVILFFIEGVMPVFVVWALVFMMWAMSRTEPMITKNTLTTWGIRSVGRLYDFQRMTNFWIETKWGTRLLRINLVDSPWHVVVVIGESNEAKIKEEMSKFVPFVEPEITGMDRFVKWLSEKLPLE
jgi:hypothetical protein